MWREGQKTLSLNHLVFLRGLAERGLLEHGPYGKPEGMAADGHVRRTPAPDYSGRSS